jgi:hypothetical protein
MHIPDMDDPFCVRPGANCFSVASWNLSYEARKTWGNVMSDDNLRAVFAGHFHDSRRATYQRPYGWPLTRNDKNGTVLQKTYVVPPLSPKFQTENVNEQSRGFALITVSANDVAWHPYWLNTLPLANADPDNLAPAQQRARVSERWCTCWMYWTIAAAIFVVFLFTWRRKMRQINKEKTQQAVGKKLQMSLPANEWAEHFFEEWKHRHDSFWQTLYRFFLAIGVLVAIPFLKGEYFAGNGICYYVFLPLIMFSALCVVLTDAQAQLKSVERLLADIREGRVLEGNTYYLGKPDPWSELTKRKGVALLFISIGLILWALWACKVLEFVGKL